MKNIKDTSGKYIQDQTFTGIEAVDTTLPAVTDVQVVGPKTIKVIFNKPVKSGSANFKLDNGSVSLSIASNNPSENAIVLNTGAELAAGTHTLVVNDSGSTSFVDYAAMPIPKTTKTFTVNADTTAPTVSVKEAKPDKITLQFSKAVKDLNNAQNVVKVGYTTIPAAKITPKAGTTTVVGGETYATEWEIDLSSAPISGNNISISIENKASVKDDQILDLWGNKLADTTVTANVVADTIKPEVTSIEAKSASKFVITFNKAVTASDATNRMNYTFYDKDGKVYKNQPNLTDAYGHPVAGTSITYDADKKQVTIDFGSYQFTPDTYLLKVEGIKDTVSYNQQTIEPTTKTVSIADASKLAVSSAVYNSSTRKLTVTFSKPVATSGDYNALDINNYTYGPNGTENKFPAGSYVELGGNNQTVVITVGGTDTPTGKLGAMVKDANGQLIDLARATTNITGTTVPATQFKGYVQNIKLLADNKVSFELTQPVKEIDASGITVAGVTATGASFENKTIKDGSGNMVYGSVVTVTLPNGSLGTDVNGSGQLSSGGSYQTNTLVLAQDSIKTVAGVSVPAGGVIVTNSDVQAKDYAAPQIKNIYTYEKSGSTNGMIDRVVVEYSEPVKAADINKNAYTVDGYTVENAYVVAANPTTTDSPTLATTGKFVVLELAESGRLDTDKQPAVKQVVDIRDTNDNVKAAESTASVATTDKAAPVILSATTAQTNASATLLSGSKAFTITLGDDLAGAYGNAISVEIVDDTAGSNTNKVSASFASNKLTIKLDSNASSGTMDLAAVKAAVEAVQVNGDASDFVVNLGGNAGTTTLDPATDTTASPVSFTGGKDVVTLTFSEALKESTINTANFTTDFDIAGTGEAGTAALSTDKKTVTLTVTAAGAEVKGASINAKANEVEDANSNAVGTATVTIN